MGNSLRCCLACVLPCGALDVVRVVHLDGQVEEYSRQISAGEILAANPNHIISKPCFQGATHQVLIVSADTELKRGHIYFLIPSTTSVSEKKKKKKQTESPTKLIDQDHLVKEVLSGKKSGHHGRRSSRVAVWRPHLESITEDL